MKRIVRTVAFVAVGAVQAATTNVWKGAASGGLWSDPANWSKTLSPTVPTVYDFSALSDGAVVTNTFAYSTDAKQLAIAGLLLGEGQGRVTLFGSPASETLVSSGTFRVPSGTTLVLALRHTTGPWQDSQSKVTLSGSGRIVFEGDAFCGTAWDYYFADAAGLRVTLGSRSAFALCGFHFYDSVSQTPATDVRLTLAADTLLASVNGKWASEICNFIDQGPYSLSVGYGASAETYAATTGTGALAFEGGGCHTLRAAPRNTGGLIVRNADVKLGRIYHLPTDPTTATSGPVQLPPETVLDIANAGCLTAFCDQTLTALRGEGTWGAINLSSNFSGVANLTVGSSSASGTTVFNGRIEGLGGLKKLGASTLVLTGANAYTGKTEVAAGTLVLRRAADPLDAPAVHFDFADTEDWMSALGGAASLTEQDGVARRAEGVAGCGLGAIDFDSSVAAPYCKFWLVADQAPVLGGNRRFTATFWFRLRDGCRGGTGDQRYLFSYGNPWVTSREWVRVYLSSGTNLNFSVGGYRYGTVPADEGFTVPVADGELYDGRWHHLALTWAEGNALSGYLDGRLLKSASLGEDLNLPTGAAYGLSWQLAANRLDGSLDEVKLFRRALTAEEILGEFARSRVVREAGAGLPAPVAQWNFNDAAAPGRDSSGNGYDLKAVVGTPAAIDAYPGTFGRSLSKATGLTVAAAEFPAKIPTGASPFTVSCRYKYVDVWQASPLVVWGNPLQPNAFFLIGTDLSSRRRPMINYSRSNAGAVRSSCSYTNLVHVSAGEETSANWTHLICTYDGSTIRMYQDGHLAHEPLTGVTLDIAADKLYVGCLPEAGNAVFSGTIDDVRIYDRALSAEQVRALTRSLATGADAPVLPLNATVSVATGATLGIEGTCPSFAALSCAGTLALGRMGSYCVGADDVFTGTLAGEGRLVVADRDLSLADGAAFAGTLAVTGARLRVGKGLGPAYVTLGAGAALDGAGRADVTLADGAVIDVDVAQPEVFGLETTGELTLPARVTIRLSGMPSLGMLKVASAGRLRPPASFADWTVVGPDGQPLAEGSPRIRFSVQGSTVVGKVVGGLCVIIR